MPTPAETTELESIHSYLRTLDLVREYLRRVTIGPEGVQVTDARDSIGLGTPSCPQIRAPIDVPPGRLEDLLQGAARLIDEIQLGCKETISLTDESARMLQPQLADEPARRKLMMSVQERTSALKVLLSALEGASYGCQPPYHPARLTRCREAMAHTLGPGDPRIRVTFEVTKIL
jgi:hypothetical protein